MCAQRDKQGHVTARERRVFEPRGQAGHVTFETPLRTVHSGRRGPRRGVSPRGPAVKLQGIGPKVASLRGTRSMVDYVCGFLDVLKETLHVEATQPTKSPDPGWGLRH